MDTLINLYVALPVSSVLPVLHKGNVVDIFIFVCDNTIKKNMLYAKGTIDFNHF